MSTRSRVGIVNANGSITSIYCHHDGYPSGVGMMLLTHYTTEEKVRELIAGGDTSGIDDDVRDCPFYKKRGETDVDARTSGNESTFRTLATDSDAEYFYLFKDGKWRGWAFDEQLGFPYRNHHEIDIAAVAQED